MEYHPNDIFNDRYVLKDLLGRGSFGEVWLSYDNVACIDVALKIYIALDNRGLEDFRNEYRSVYEIEHPNILKPMHFAVWGRQPYLVMHYCPVSSESLIGQVTEDDIWKFISDVSGGLAYLHEQNIIHRDIKPDNILRDSHGRYVLTDFGLSKKLRASLRRNSTRAHQEDISGALSYMGPELFEANPEAVKATDIWAFGVTVYEMLMGELPFMGQGGIMLKNGADIPELPNTYSYGLRKLVHDCLQKNPWDRPTAAQLTSYKGLKKPAKETVFIRVLKSRIVKVVLLVCLFVCLAAIVDILVKKTKTAERASRELAILDTIDVLDSLEDFILSIDTDSTSLHRIIANNSISTKQDKDLIPSDFVLVPGGHLTYKDNYYGDYKKHTVKLDSFYICKFELTQGEFLRVKGELTKENFTWLQSESWYSDDDPPYVEVQGDSIPVRGTYKEFVEYCNIRSEAEGYDGFYVLNGQDISIRKDGNGYRLITPYEWVFAAYGGNVDRKQKYLGGDKLGDVAWVYENSNKRPHPVGLKRPNSLGLFDIQGNVKEVLQGDETITIYVSMMGGYNVSNWNYSQAYDPTYIWGLKSVKGTNTWTYGTRIALIPKGISNGNLRIQYDL